MIARYGCFLAPVASLCLAVGLVTLILYVLLRVLVGAPLWR